LPKEQFIFLEKNRNILLGEKELDVNQKEKFGKEEL